VSPHFNRDFYSPTLQIDHSFGAAVRLTSISSYFHSNYRRPRGRRFIGPRPFST